MKFLTVNCPSVINKFIVGKLYGNQNAIKERHRHRYEVNLSYVEELQKHGLQFVATDTEGYNVNT